jgi:hypothetical protein
MKSITAIGNKIAKLNQMVILGSFFITSIPGINHNQYHGKANL